MKSKVACMFVAIVMLAVLLVPGHADGPNNDVQKSRPPTAQELARSKQKKNDADHVVKMYRKYVGGQASQQAMENAILKYVGTWGKGKPRVDVATTIERLGIVDPHLGVAEVNQLNDDWCAPASAYMLLAYLGYWWDPYYHELTQSNLAAFMGTDEEGTDLTKVGPTLNQWIGYSFEYVVDWSPSAYDVLYQTYLDYACDYPVIYDTYMNDQLGHLPGWSGSHKHYITGDGYDFDASEVHYLDPWYESPMNGAKWVDADLMSSVMSQHGMVW